ncbi:MAG: UDP-N-acetylmuramoyl-tripeptide--D-alanyl-D-alanine ligase [Fimbriimonas sp.]|nr:UDP-N-acetylmuramoyl-tripeptide--D-alanyl-D-alanine ligase [Fimbriimonas sp.]
MTPVKVATFAEWLGGEARGFSDNDCVSSFALDSNSVRPGDLFLAIRGERVDGHTFVSSALGHGALGSIAERPVEPPAIVVPNLVEALAKAALLYRNKFDGPVVGITGSAGKTTTKEFIAAALTPLGPILKTEGNRNTEYTAPLLWFDLEPIHKAAVVEMSMRGFGQIRHLASFSRPTLGVITNIGFAHMLMVGSRSGIATAKSELLELLPSDGTAVLWHEDEFLGALRSKSPSHTVTFGADEGSDCRILSYRPLSWYASEVTGSCLGREWRAEVPAVGRHIALNAAAAILVATCLGVEAQAAADRLGESVLPPLRMEVVEQKGATILLDTYNASPPSMIAAIETLAELPVAGRRFAVIGEMRELGDYTGAAHQEIGSALARSSIERVLFYGLATRGSQEEAVRLGMPEDRVEWTESIDDVRRFLSQLLPGDALLLKGSRSLELERALGNGGEH